MNRIALTALAATTLPLAGCMSLPDNASTVDRIQALAIAACAYVPTAEVIVDLLDLDWQGTDKAAAIAAAICAALAPVPVARGQAAPEPVVSGVPVEGQFVGQ